MDAEQVVSDFVDKESRARDPALAQKPRLHSAGQLPATLRAVIITDGAQREGHDREPERVRSTLQAA
jgi:hypothetical protein